MVRAGCKGGTACSNPWSDRSESSCPRSRRPAWSEQNRQWWSRRGWISLRGLQHGTGLIVVKGERPEFGGWDVRRKRDLVGLAAVEILALGIHEGGEVLRADVRQTHDHRRRNARGVEEH